MTAFAPARDAGYTVEHVSPRLEKGVGFDKGFASPRGIF